MVKSHFPFTDLVLEVARVVALYWDASLLSGSTGW